VQARRDRQAGQRPLGGKLRADTTQHRHRVVGPLDAAGPLLGEPGIGDGAVAAFLADGDSAIADARHVAHVPQ